MNLVLIMNGHCDQIFAIRIINKRSPIVSSTRINPLHDLKQTARDMAAFLVFGEAQKLMTCLLEAKQIYQQPLNSWATGLFYRLFQTRQRFSDIDHTLKRISCQQDEDNSKVIIGMFESGGWEETSFNTTLIRTLVKYIRHVADKDIYVEYETSAILPLEAVTELKTLLIFEQARLMNEDVISSQQKLIDKLKSRKIETQNELLQLTRQMLECEKNLDSIKTNEQSASIRVLELLAERNRFEQELELHNKQLTEINAERKRQEKALEDKLFLAANLNIDLSQLTDKQREEAQRIAVTAIRMYLKDLEDQAAKQKELGNTGSIKIARAVFKEQQAVNSEKSAEEEQNRLTEKQKELAATPVSAGASAVFKASLAALFSRQVVAPRKPTMRDHQKALAQSEKPLPPKVVLPKLAGDENYPQSETFSLARKNLMAFFAQRPPVAKPVEQCQVVQTP